MRISTYPSIQKEKKIRKKEKKRKIKLDESLPSPHFVILCEKLSFIFLMMLMNSQRLYFILTQSNSKNCYENPNRNLKKKKNYHQNGIRLILPTDLMS